MNRGKTCVIMQPTYMPWIGYFDIMDQADVFIFLDNVQFAKRSWQQRNRIKTPKGLELLTVPAVVSGRYTQSIKDVEIHEADFWKKHLDAVRSNYKQSPYYEEYFPGFSSVYKREPPYSNLADLNIAIIEWLAQALGIKTRMERASVLDVQGKRSGLLASICAHAGATQYLSPLGSHDYLLEEENVFTDKNIKVSYHNYTHPEYRQNFLPFLPFASAVDIIFNEGPGAMKIVRSGRGAPLSAAEVRERMSV